MRLLSLIFLIGFFFVCCLQNEVEAFTRLRTQMWPMNPLFWNMHDMTTPMPYWVNPNVNASNTTSSATKDDILAAVKRAADVWNIQGDADFSFVYQGTTEIGHVRRDGFLVVIDGPESSACRTYPDGGKVAAFSQGINILDTGEIVEVDINICTNNFDFFADQDPATMPRDRLLDLWGIMVHEFGHNLGLAHPMTYVEGAPPCSVMTPGIYLSEPPCRWPWNSTNERNLTPDDIAGIQAIYGILTPYADRDDDRDGLTNGEEERLGTNPSSADTDEDGIMDGEELRAGLNPLQPDNPLPSIMASLLLDDEEERAVDENASESTGPFRLVKPLPDDVLEIMMRYMRGRL